MQKTIIVISARTRWWYSDVQTKYKYRLNIICCFSVYNNTLCFFCILWGGRWDGEPQPPLNSPLIDKDILTLLTMCNSLIIKKLWLLMAVKNFSLVINARGHWHILLLFFSGDFVCSKLVSWWIQTVLYLMGVLVQRMIPMDQFLYTVYVVIFEWLYFRKFQKLQDIFENKISYNLFISFNYYYI